MLIIEMAKIELIGGYIGFMLIIEMAKIELTNYRRPKYWRPFNVVIKITKIKLTEIELAAIMLIIEMAKIELTGGHIGFIGFI